MKLIIFKIIIFLIDESVWSAETKYSDKFKSLCGERTLKKRIIGGSDTVPGEFPFIARLLINDRQPPKFVCGATLITDLHILTATHCFMKHLNSTFIVSIGDYNIAPYKVSDNSVVYNALTIISASNFITHPIIADLAIVKLAQKVTFTRWISPICLPYKFSPDSLIGEDFTVIGFGLASQKPKKHPKILQKVDITLRPFEYCTNFSHQLPGKLCTDNPGYGPCFGDSGGPLFKLLTQEDGLRYTQVGIVANGADSHCGKKRPGVIYTNVNYYLNWIEKTLNE